MKQYRMHKGLNVILGVAYLALIIGVGFVSDTHPGFVFLGTIPILLHLITIQLFADNDQYNKVIFWVSPLLFPILLFVLWNSQKFNLISSMDGPALLAFNVCINIFFNICVILFSLRSDADTDTESMRGNHKSLKQHYLERQHALAKQQNKAYEERIQHMQKTHDEKLLQMEQRLNAANQQLEITKENFTTNLRSIEDKCKAINFVIGRVYANKKGGSPKIRETLNIDSELYNKFSEISSNFDESYAVHLLTVLEQIYHRILLFEQQEKTLFTIDADAHITLSRNPNGDDTVLEVLKKNDKDPIEDYYLEAKEICIKLMNYLKTEFVKTE
jgi:hypothetical protein